MTISIAAISPLSRATAGVTSPAAANPTQSSSVASALIPISVSGMPLIQMPSEQFAALQSGSALRQPDPAKTAAQNAAPAFAVIKDAKTGQVLGGVWPNAGVVSKANIPIDNRITGNSNWNEVTQYLAQDIAKGTGTTVTIQYFQPGDPNAPTFGEAIG